MLQHQVANSKQAFLLPPDVIEASGLHRRCNVFHPAHLWFQFVASSLFLKELPTERTSFGDCFGSISAADRILHQSNKM